MGRRPPRRVGRRQRRARPLLAMRVLGISRPAQHLMVAMVKRSQTRCIRCAATPSPTSIPPATPPSPVSWPHPSTNSAADSYSERHSKRRWAQYPARRQTAKCPQQERPSTMWTGVVDTIQVVIWPLCYSGQGFVYGACGGPGRTRTDDRRGVNALLYQLSYRSRCSGGREHVARVPSACTQN